MTLKSHVLLSEIHALALLVARSALPSSSFSAPDRPVLGGGAGEECRILLEKLKVMEGKIRHQIENIEKLVHVEQEKGDKESTDAVDG